MAVDSLNIFQAIRQVKTMKIKSRSEKFLYSCNKGKNRIQKYRSGYVITPYCALGRNFEI